MAIVSRTLIDVEPDGHGGVWAKWYAVAENGRKLRPGRRRWASEAAAQTALDAHDFLPELREREKKAVYRHIKAGNDPSTFVRTDLTVSGFDQYVLRTFARSRLEDEQDFMLNAAPWVAAKNATGGPPSIAGRLGISNGRAQTIHDRAERIELTIAPNLALDEADIDLEVGRP